MDSRKKNNEHTRKSEEEDIHQETNSCQSSKCYKPVCNSCSECETCHTVVVNYKLGQQHKSIAEIPRKRERWNQMLDAINTHKDLKTEMQFDIYNLRNLYQMSGHNLQCNSSSTTSNVSTSNTVISKPGGLGKNQRSIHSIKVDIFKMTPIQEAQAPEQALIEMKNIDDCSIASGTKSKDARRKQSNCSHNMNVEIFKLPLKQAKCQEIHVTTNDLIPEVAEIIIISSGDDEVLMSDETKLSEMEIESHSKQELKMSVENAIDCCHSSSKCTQKPEALSETQTYQRHVEMPSNLLEIPSSSSSVHYNSAPRSSPISSTHKQRQLELHRLRVQVEKKRLELLEIKLKRERDELLHEQMVSENELRMQGPIFKELNDERDV